VVWNFQTTYSIGWYAILCIVANASIFQGSVVGPPSFVIVASDFHPKHHFNLMTKYADDTYPMVGSKNIGTVMDESGNIQAWATRKNVRIYPNKTKEMILYRQCSNFDNPPAHPLIRGLSVLTLYEC